MVTKEIFGKNKKGFTLIELLVVIAIIGLLSVIAIVSLNTTRSKSRDVKRLADIRQVQTALALFYNTYDVYPDSDEPQPIHIALAGVGVGGLGEFVAPPPNAPEPADGDCTLSENIYMYQSLENNTNYQLSYCLGQEINNIKPGLSYASPAYLQMVQDPENIVDDGGGSQACIEWPSYDFCSANSDCCNGVCCAGYCCHFTEICQGPPPERCMSPM